MSQSSTSSGSFRFLDQDFVLLIVGVPPTVWMHSVDATEKVIGRMSDCDATVFHKSVSRKHAKIWSDGRSIYICDLGSSNGTFVGKERITSTVSVPSGAEIRIAFVRLRVISRSQFEKEWQSFGEASTFMPVDGPETGIHTHIGLNQRTECMNSLSEAQLRVLRLILTGLSAGDIAKSLFISVNTVNSHVKAIHKAFNVNSRSALMAAFIDPALVQH